MYKAGTSSIRHVPAEYKYKVLMCQILIEILIQHFPKRKLPKFKDLCQKYRKTSQK